MRIKKRTRKIIKELKSQYENINNRERAIRSILWYLIEDVPSDSPLIYPIINVYQKYLKDLSCEIHGEFFHAHSYDKKKPNNSFLSIADYNGAVFYGKHLGKYDIMQVDTDYIDFALNIKVFLENREVKKIIANCNMSKFFAEHVKLRIEKENEHIIFFNKKNRNNILKHEYSFYMSR